MSLLDLPDELLLLILTKLNVIETLFGQRGVHSRLDQLLFDDTYVRKLDFTLKSWNDSISPMNDAIIDRICEQVLPHIKDKVIQLTVEPNAIERVLRQVNYPKLSSLSLINFPQETLLRLFTENTFLIKLSNEQIRFLSVVISEDRTDNNDLNLLELILSLSTCLTDLTFHQSYAVDNLNYPFISQFSSRTFSTLTKLDIHLKTFEECLWLFNGRFPCLSRCLCYVHDIDSISSSSSIEHENKFLSIMKSFSLTSYRKTDFYDDCVVPLIRQMSNLEELRLYLCVSKCDTFGVVDGNDLRKNITNHLSQLKRFHFSIYTYLYQLANPITNTNVYPSNDNLQESFISNHFGEVESYVHPTSSKDIYQCHIYSIPYQFRTFMRLSCSFSGGIFTSVRTLALNDVVSWDEHFFNTVNQSFPCIETLMICNPSPQINKSQFPMTVFDRLIQLCVNLLHMDYIEQLLLSRYTHLPRLRQLEIQYDQLNTLTNCFTIDPTQLNCLQIEKLEIEEPFIRPQNFSQFFPSYD